MLSFKIIGVLLATVLSQVQAIPTPEPVIPGYTITDFVWEVESYPGGPKANVTGTVQDVVAHLSAENPNWESDFGFNKTLHASTDSDPAHQKRGLSFPFTGVLCNIRVGEWGWAGYFPILDGISYLKGVGGTPTMGPGPGACGRVSCSYDSAIYWCNDAQSSFSLPGFSTIAAGAQAIIDNCKDNPNTFAPLTGQVFAKFLQDWNTVVRGDRC
ncbi:hypothetical protein DM02DRAFT_623677 [Periconia macrospinosa]|uniref:Uncharacterized protein n=1 Tax=Periconia macrospinosa TaxID=97972 RepID=A0A2V1E5X4_9PLEO|nr:hypothetical protein DM02DRAFT_623677 [Periconia macrospinosa]